MLHYPNHVRDIQLVSKRQEIWIGTVASETSRSRVRGGAVIGEFCVPPPQPPQCEIGTVNTLAPTIFIPRQQR